MDRRIKAFLATAEEGNVTAAARRIGLEQPSLTKMLQRLELDVGARLFDRRPRGVVLTPAGQSFYARARRIQLEYNSAVEEIAGLMNGRLGVFRLAAGALYRRLYVPQLFEILAQEFPETQLDVMAGVDAKTVPALVAGDLDMFVGRIDGIDDLGDVEKKALISVDDGVFFRNGHPIGSQRLTPKTLSQWTWIVYQDDNGNVPRLHEYFERHRLPYPRIAVSTSSFEIGLRIVEKTDYLMVAPVELIKIITNSNVHVRRPEKPVREVPTGAVVRRSSVGFPIISRTLAILGDLAHV